MYTAADVKVHARSGDLTGPLAEAGFKGHPSCGFCRKPFYGDNELFNHMQQSHEQCFLCRRARPDKYVYYRDYAELEGHFPIYFLSIFLSISYLFKVQGCAAPHASHVMGCAMGFAGSLSVFDDLGWFRLASRPSLAVARQFAHPCIRLHAWRRRGPLLLTPRCAIAPQGTSGRSTLRASTRRAWRRASWSSPTSRT